MKNQSQLARDYIEKHLSRMEIGNECMFSGDVFRSAYPCGWPSIYDTHVQSFLSKQMGSGWGEWTCEHLADKDAYKVGKHKGGNKRVYIDPDREHLYMKQPDGTYKPRKES